MNWLAVGTGASYVLGLALMFSLEKPGYELYLSFLMLSVAVMAVVILVLRAQGFGIVAWFTTEQPLTGGKKPIDAIKDAASSLPALSVYLLLATSITLELALPTVHSKWLGGAFGWAFFFAALVSMAVGGKLIQSGKGWLPFGGVLLILVGFVSPLLMATRPGQVVARSYSETMDYVQHGRYSAPLKLGRWTSLLEASDTKVPKTFQPEKCCIIFRNKRVSGAVEYYAQSPSGDKRGSLTMRIDGKEVEIKVENDVTGKMVNVLDATTTVAGPDRVYYHF